VLKSLEEARNAKLIGAPLEACVKLEAGPDIYPLLERYQAELPALFITSEVKLLQGEALRATIEKASGVKCERCWKYTSDIGVDAEFPTICGPCAEAVHAAIGA
jgi:isoleucyl-tRNA synthetase